MNHSECSDCELVPLPQDRPYEILERESSISNSVSVFPGARKTFIIAKCVPLHLIEDNYLNDSDKNRCSIISRPIRGGDSKWNLINVNIICFSLLSMTKIQQTLT